MKTKLIVFVLSAAILGSNTAALARGKDGNRYEEPRVQHSQQRDWGKNRHHARSHRNMQSDRHSHRRMDDYPRHGRSWSGHHPHYNQGWSDRHPHGRHARHRHHYPVHRAHAPARPYHRPASHLSIILHGHF